MKCAVQCRGKPANTATVVTYTLGFTAAALVAGLAYFYAKRALLKIEQRAQPLGNSIAPPLWQNAPSNTGQSKVTTEAASEDDLDSDQSGQPMLLQQHRRDVDEDRASLAVSDEDSPSQHKLLHSSHHMAADSESSPV